MGDSTATSKSTKKVLKWENCRLCAEITKLEEVLLEEKEKGEDPEALRQEVQSVRGALEEANNRIEHLERENISLRECLEIAGTDEDNDPGEPYHMLEDRLQSPKISTTITNRRTNP